MVSGSLLPLTTPAEPSWSLFCLSPAPDHKSHPTLQAHQAHFHLFPVACPPPSSKKGHPHPKMQGATLSRKLPQTSPCQFSASGASAATVVGAGLFPPLWRTQVSLLAVSRHPAQGCPTHSSCALSAPLLTHPLGEGNDDGIYNSHPGPTMNSNPGTKPHTSSQATQGQSQGVTHGRSAMRDQVRI